MKKGYMLNVITASYDCEDKKLSVYNDATDLDDGFLLAMFDSIDDLIEHVTEYYDLSEEEVDTLRNVSEESWTSPHVVRTFQEEDDCLIRKYQTIMIDISSVMHNVYKKVSKKIDSVTSDIEEFFEDRT